MFSGAVVLSGAASFLLLLQPDTMLNMKSIKTKTPSSFLPFKTITPCKNFITVLPLDREK
jgi:hypothetical protein